MKLFLSRLKHTAATLLTYIVGIGIIVGLAILSTVIPHTVTTVIAWIVWIILGIFVLALLCYFIHWQFIEPFRKGEK